VLAVDGEELEALPEAPSANDDSPPTDTAQSAADPSKTTTGASTNGTAAGSKSNERPERRHPHRRRRLDLTKLPLVTVEIVPDEVKAAGGVGYERIGEESSERLAYRPGCYVRFRIIRPTFVAVSPASDATTNKVAASTEIVAGVERARARQPRRYPL